MGRYRAPFFSKFTLREQFARSWVGVLLYVAIVFSIADFCYNVGNGGAALVIGISGVMLATCTFLKAFEPIGIYWKRQGILGFAFCVFSFLMFSVTIGILYLVSINFIWLIAGILIASFFDFKWVEWCKYVDRYDVEITFHTCTLLSWIALIMIALLSGYH